MFSVEVADTGRDVIFHLNPGVNLKEIGLSGTGYDPLPGSHIVVTYMGCKFQGVLNNLIQNLFLIKVIVKTGGVKTGSGLHPFLASGGLDGTVSGTEMNTFPMAGAEELHFQVVIVGETLFDENPAIAKLPFGIALYLAINPAKFGNLGDFFNSHAATACRCLNKNRGMFNILQFLAFQEMLGDLFGLHLIVYWAVGAGDGGDVELIGHLFGVDLIPEVLDYLPVGSDKDQGVIAGGGTSGKTEIFREKSVTWVNGRAAGVGGHGKEIVGLCVTVDTPGVLIGAAGDVAAHML